MDIDGCCYISYKQIAQFHRSFHSGLGTAEDFFGLAESFLLPAEDFLLPAPEGRPLAAEGGTDLEPEV